MKVEISMGDFIDRHSILSIKQANGLEAVSYTYLRAHET